MSHLNRAVKALGKCRSGHGGKTVIAEGCQVSNTTLTRWCRQGHLPFSDLYGWTRYAATIEKLTGGQVTAAQLHDDIRDAVEARAEAA